MEPEGSLPHSQVPANCPYPEQDQFSPFPNIPLPDDQSKYYPPIYPWILQVVSFSQDARVYASTSSPHALHAPPISFFSISSPE